MVQGRLTVSLRRWLSPAKLKAANSEHAQQGKRVAVVVLHEAQEDDMVVRGTNQPIVITNYYFGTLHLRLPVALPVHLPVEL